LDLNTSAEPKVARTTQPNNKTGLPSAEPKVRNENESFRLKMVPKLSDSLLEPCHSGECPAPKGEYPELDSRLKHAGMTTPVDRKSLNLGGGLRLKMGLDFEIYPTRAVSSLDPNPQSELGPTPIHTLAC
jgi:hypothetical protein